MVGCSSAFSGTQGTVSWTSAPYLKPLLDGTLVDRIYQNPVDWVDTLPRPRVAGHISVAAATNTTSAAATKTVDVTDAVRPLAHMVSDLLRDVNEVAVCVPGQRGL